MRVTEISVGCGRSAPHPREPGVNVKPSVFLRARLEPDDDPFTAAGSLQAMADSMVEMHIDGLMERTAIDPIVGEVTPQEKEFIRKLVAATRQQSIKDRAEGAQS